MSKLNTDPYDEWMKDIAKELAAQQVQESALVEAQFNAYDNDLKALIVAAQQVLHTNSNPFQVQDKNKEPLQKLREALDKFLPWLEEGEDPRRDGWVDDKGRP